MQPLEQQPTAVGEPPRTADPAVDAAMDTLAEALRAALPHALEHQVAAFELAHRTLQDRLADVEG